MVAERTRQPDADSPHWLKLMLAIRTQRHWSQAQLARELSLSVSTIAGWEAQRQQPRPIFVRLFALLLQESG